MSVGENNIGSGVAGGANDGGNAGVGAANGAAAASNVGAGTNSGAGSTNAVADWTTGFSDEVKGYVQTKGFKDAATVVESYRNLEKAIGVPKERLLKLPEKEDDQAWGEIYDRLGKPKEAKDYKIPMPEKGGDEKFAEWARTTFHGLNLTSKQAEALVGKWNEYTGGMMEAQAKARNDENVKQEQALKTEWGAAFDQNIKAASQAAVALGLNKETLDKLEGAMGYAGVMKFVSGLASKVGEDVFVTGSNGERITTTQAAVHKISELKNDREFIRRYATGDYEAKKEMERLHKIAYPGETQFGAQ